MADPPPGAPSVVTSTPATRPVIKLAGVTMLPELKSLLVIEATEPVASLIVVVPYPITTTSFKACASSSRLTVIKLTLAATSWVL